MRGPIALVLAAALVASACAAAPTPTPGSPTLPAGAPVRVSLGIYSGRPDPEWQLTDEQAAELRRLVAGLTVAVGEPFEGGLGYHGFFIRIGPAAGAGSTFVAYRGTIAAPGSGSRTVWLDPGGTVERWLLATGATVLNEQELREGETGIGPPPSPGG